VKQQTTKDCAIDYENPWLCQGTTFTTNDIGDQFGFVYRITNLQSGKQYIGRKYFYQKRKPRGGGRRVTSESNWKKYYGSCPELTADIKSIGKEAFKRELLSVHATVGKTNYEETRQLFINNVLTEKLSDGTPAYYNSNILGRYYRKDYFAYDTEV
jgi:hypothetical protein|tara:strand:+ start:1096 stop:1563 length:468 start_codon:yes stop_codon:yes gene_type:complete